MIRPSRVVKVKPLRPHWLRLWFTYGSVQEVDVGALIDAGVFANVHADPSEFARVDVDSEAGTVTWPGGLDLDPDVLYGLAEPAGGPSLPRRRLDPGAAEGQPA